MDVTLITLGLCTVVLMDFLGFCYGFRYIRKAKQRVVGCDGGKGWGGLLLCVTWTRESRLHFIFTNGSC